MKRTLTFLLAASLLLGLAACRQKAPDTLPDDTDNSESSAFSPQTSKSLDDMEIIVKNLVLADNDICTFTIKSINPDSDWGYILEVFLENKLDVPLAFSINDSVVNGYMCSPYWTAVLEPGAKEDSQVLWYGTDLSHNGIENIWEIEFLFCAEEPEKEDYTFSEVFSIYPYGESVETMAENERQPKSGEQALIEADDFTLILTEFDAETAFAYAVSVYTENNSEVDVLFTIDNVKVNGLDCNPYWAVKVLEGRKANSYICWMENDFNKNGITEIEEIEFLLKVYDAKDWSALPLLYKNFTVKP